MSDLEFTGPELQSLIDAGIIGVTATTNAIIQADIKLFIAELEHEVTVLRIGGMSDEAIFASLMDDAQNSGPVFRKFENDIKRTLFGSVQQASIKGELLTYQDAGLDVTELQWVTFSKKPCPDCDIRDGRTEVPLRWQDVGLPGTGWSLCGHSCNCRLMPVELNVPKGLGVLTSTPVAVT